MNNEEEIVEEMPKEHPTYASIVVSKSQVGGSGRALNGSSILHNQIVHLEIHEATYERHHGVDSWFPHKKIIDVDLSPTQWAEMISSIGNGGGTPCTIRYRADKPTERDMEVPHINKFTQHTAEFKQDLTDIKKQAQSFKDELAERLTKKKPLGVKEQEELLHKWVAFCNNLEPNLRFAQTCFDEQVDRTVTEAKGEIEAYFDHKINQIAMRAVAENIDSITSDTSVVHIG